MRLFGKPKKTIVVSADELLRSKGVKSAIAPRQYLQTLRALSRFMQREKVNVIAVVAGTPLNKAPHNKLFEGVRVRYVKTGEIVGGELLKLAKRAGTHRVLVTTDTQLEQRMVNKKIDTLRMSTFRKLLDDFNDQGGQNNNGNRDRGNNNGNRRDRNNGGKRRDRGNRSEKGNRPERKKQKKQKPKPTSEQDEISQMIDLVD